MWKVLLLLVGTAVLWVPAVSVAGDSSPSPSKLTAKTERPDARSEVSNPASTCQSRRTELNFAASHGGGTFTQLYGTDAANGRGGGPNAFGKCVSVAKHKDKSDGEGSAKSQDGHSFPPAMTCKAIRAKDLAHFQATYGRRPNAFGKCVAGQAHSKKS
jgi:hypothetical protein